MPETRYSFLIGSLALFSLLTPTLGGCSDDDDPGNTGNRTDTGIGGSDAGDAGTATGGATGTGGTGGTAGGAGGTAGAGGAGGFAPALPPSVRLEPVATGLTSPVAIKEAPDDSGRMFVVDQAGTIRILDSDGELLEEPFLDLGDKIVELMDDFDERGVLGLAFHPDYSENGRFFVYYSAPLRAGAPADFNHTSHIAEFTVSDDPNVADPDSERILLQVDQPQFNHNAGQITFGPDGFLYIPLGDGGGADDVGTGHVEDWYETNEGGNGQDVESNLLGSILRIDVDGGFPYGIPADNPFVADPTVPGEIWAYGFRNPFRISFDEGGEEPQLFVSDAGQNQWEEVSIVEVGGNYGWNVKEGTHCFSTENPDESLDSCPEIGARGEPLVDPIIEYLNVNQEGGLGLVVIGGFVYRGDDLEDFQGQYIFGDYSRTSDTGDGTLFVATPPETGGGLWNMEELAISNRDDGRIGEFVLSFGQDSDNELYVLTTEMPGPTGTTGKVYRLDSAEDE